MDEDRGADRKTSREVELLRKRVKTLMKEKSQVLEPWEHTLTGDTRGSQTPHDYTAIKPSPRPFLLTLLVCVRRWSRWSCCRRCTPRT